MAHGSEDTELLYYNACVRSVRKQYAQLTLATLSVHGQALQESLGP